MRIQSFVIGILLGVAPRGISASVSHPASCCRAAVREVLCSFHCMSSDVSEGTRLRLLQRAACGKKQLGKCCVLRIKAGGRYAHSFTVIVNSMHR